MARLTGAPAPSSSGRRKLPAPVPDAMARERQAQKQERLAQHRKLQEESASVLQRFSSSGGVARHRVQRIERVQHLLLYSDYCRWGECLACPFALRWQMHASSACSTCCCTATTAGGESA